MAIDRTGRTPTHLKGRSAAEDGRTAAFLFSRGMRDLGSPGDLSPEWSRRGRKPRACRCGQAAEVITGPGQIGPSRGRRRSGQQSRKAEDHRDPESLPPEENGAPAAFFQSRYVRSAPRVGPAGPIRSHPASPCSARSGQPRPSPRQADEWDPRVASRNPADVAVVSAHPFGSAGPPPPLDDPELVV